MPGLDGMTLLTVALADDPDLPVIVMTAYGTVASAVRAIGEGAFDYLTKPFTRDQLLTTVQRAIRHRGLTRENRALREQVARGARTDELVGSSPAFVKLMKSAKKVAPTDASVLISGETGTGKELIARYLHAHGSRKKGPFVPVDCASLPEHLLESELFGHERGAFTGADTQKIGLLEHANKGTVFLDECGELTMELQAKFLRALEERQIRRLGGSTMIDIDVRVIAATNVDLKAAVAAGTFREDLYYRLDIVPLRVPPLRERKADILVLLQKFLTHYSAAQQRRPPRLSPDVVDVFEAYNWPGNIRELRNLTQRLIVLNESGHITLADLPEALRPLVSEMDDVLAEGPLPYQEARTKALQLFQARYVERLLKASDGNVTKAARTARVSRRTVHRWIVGADDPVTGQDHEN
jgi:two-component system response regulator HydG